MYLLQFHTVWIVSFDDLNMMRGPSIDLTVEQSTVSLFSPPLPNLMMMTYGYMGGGEVN